MDILNLVKTRYSAKAFDPTKKLTEEQLVQIEDLLQLSPSSTNIQPWHFIIASSDDAKKRIVDKGCQGFFSFNADKVLKASAVVIFASKIDLTQEYLHHVLEKEDLDGRFPEKEHKEQNHFGRNTFSHMHKLDYKDFQHWADKQVYLNLGNFLLGTAGLGLDSLTMEGVDLKAIDLEFGLREKGFTSSFVVAVGYHSDEDFNKNLPKSRLPKEEIIERI